MMLSTASCLDQLPDDAIPADDAISTVSEADQAIMGVYAAFKSPALYSGNLTLLPDLQADLAYAVDGYTNVYGDIWRWNILSTNSDTESVYAALYTVISRANFLLEYLPRVRRNASDSDYNKLETIEGEALFARALAHAELIRMYCKSYESSQQAENELGVVCMDRYYNEKPITRSSLEASYQFVISDLERAAYLLRLGEDYDPAVDGSLYDHTYFNEYTVYALRARVALYMKDWDNAIKYSSLIINSGYYTLSNVNQSAGNGMNYYEYLWQLDASTETIWKVGFTINSYGGSLGRIFFNYDYVSLKPDYVPALWVLSLYDASDLRYEAFFRTYTTGYSHGLQWPLLMKYWGNANFESYNMLHLNMPKVFRLSEQYLIRAEAYVSRAQGNDYSLAAKDITRLRTARYSAFGGGVTITAENGMQVIEEERVKELYMEGFRLTDLKRWHKGFERTPQQNSLPHGSSLRVEADDPLFVWPIPQHELEAPGSNIQPNESN